jgi:hypothetical protein
LKRAKRTKKRKEEGLKNNLHLNDVDDDGAIMQIPGSKAEDKLRNQYSYSTNPFGCPKSILLNRDNRGNWCNPMISHTMAYTNFDVTQMSLIYLKIALSLSII